MVVVWTNVSTTLVEVVIRVESTLMMTSAQFVGTSVTTQGVKLIFFLIATWLLNSSKW